MQSPCNEDWISAPQAAKRLGVTPKTLLSINLRRLEMKHGKRVLRRYLVTDIEAYLSENLQGKACSHT